MISNSWTISLIVGAAILIIVVPLLLWIRYSKEGKKAFSIAEKKDLDKQIAKINAQMKEFELELEISNEKLKNIEEEKKEILIRKINKLKKDILGLNKRLKNLNEEKIEKKKQLDKITKNKTIK